MKLYIYHKVVTKTWFDIFYFKYILSAVKNNPMMPFIITE